MAPLAVPGPARAPRGSAPCWAALPFVAALYAVAARGRRRRRIGLRPEPGLLVADRGARRRCRASRVARAGGAPAERAARVVAARSACRRLGGRLHRLGGASTRPSRRRPTPSVGCALDPYFVLLLAAPRGAPRRGALGRAPAHLRNRWLERWIPACAASAVASQLLLPPSSTGGKPMSEQITLLLYPALRRPARSGHRGRPGAAGAGRPDARWGSSRSPYSAAALGDPVELPRRGRHHQVGRRRGPAVRGRRPWRSPWRRGPRGPAAASSGRPAAAPPAAVPPRWRPRAPLLRRDHRDLILASLTLAVAALGAGVIRWLLAVRHEAQASVLREVADELRARRSSRPPSRTSGGEAIATADAERLMGLATEAWPASSTPTVCGAGARAAGHELELRADSGRAGGRPGLDFSRSAWRRSAPGAAVVRGTLSARRIERKDGPWGVIAVLHAARAASSATPT